MLKPDENPVLPPTGETSGALPQPIAPSLPPNNPIAPGNVPQVGVSSTASVLRHEIRVWTRDLLIAIGLALVIIVFLYQPVKVEGTSMAPLLSDQERIFINKFVYRFEPIDRGDVVVFWYPLDHSKSFHQAGDWLAGRNDRDSPRRGLREWADHSRAVRAAAIRRCYRLWADARAPRMLFCYGRSPDQLQRFTRLWPGGKPVHLWPGRVRLLAGRPLRLFVDH